MTLEEAQTRAIEVRELYARLETKRYGRAWSTEEIMLGYVGDVGDLAKLIQGTAGIRESIDLEEKLAHELADCLWSLLVLADRLDIDLGQAFETTMSSLARDIRARLAA